MSDVSENISDIFLKTSEKILFSTEMLTANKPSFFHVVRVKSIISNRLSNNMAVFTDISAYNDSFSSNDYPNMASHNCAYTKS